MSKKINALKVNIGPLHGFDFIPIFDPTVGEEERITVDKLKSYVLSGFTGSITGGTYNVSGEYLPLSGGTVTGGTIFTDGVTANTVSNLDYIDFNTNPSLPTTNSGMLFFDNVENALSYKPITNNNDVTINLGQENVIIIYNNTGTQINNGQVLSITGSTSGRSTVALAIASDSNNTLFQVDGVATHDIPNGEFGFMTKFGLVHDIDLSSFNNGQDVFLSQTVAGGLSSFQDLFFTGRTSLVGHVIDNSSSGILEVDIDNEPRIGLVTALEGNILTANNSSTGVFEFSGLTKISNTTFNVSPIKAWVIDNVTNPINPSVKYVNYTGGTHTDNYVTTAFETFVYLTSGGTVGQQSTPLTEQQRRENIFLGKLGHPDRTSINLVFSQPDFVLSPLSQLRDMFAPINLINGGVVPSTNGSNLKFNTSSGYLHGLGINFTLDKLSPNTLYIPGQSPCTFQYRTQTGGTVTNVTDIDPLNYDVNGVKTPITGTKTTNQRIYLLQNGTFRVMYGQHQYNNFADAIAALQTETFTPFPNFINNAVLIGILTVSSTATDLTDTSKARFFFASKFGETVGAAGGTSTTTLQQAYNNSSNPEIITNSLLDGVQFRGGTGIDTDKNVIIENNAGVQTAWINADGSSTFSTISASTYYNLPKDIYVTGGTYSDGVITFSNSTGGTFTVTVPSNYSAGPISGSTGWSSTGSGQMNLPALKVALFNNSNNYEPSSVYNISSGTTGSGGIPSLINNDTNYIVVEYNNGSPIYNVYTNDSVIDDSSVILIYIVYRANNFIHTLEFGNYGSGLPNKLHDRFVMTDRFGWESGLSLGLSGNTGTVTLDSGVVWDASYRQSLNAVNSQSDTFFKNYHSGGTWVYSTTGKTINNTYYDTTSNIVSATAGKYLVNWYYRGQEVSGHLYEVYGTSQYDTVADAELSVEPLLPELITSHAFLTGRIIVQVGANTGLTQSAFVRVFQSTQVTNHNDLLGIQGGTSGQYYHLNSNQYNNIALTNTNNNFSTNQTVNGTLQATTISASTYQNLPIDIRVTGGTYSNGTATFTNNTGGTFNVTGFTTGYTLTSSAINTALGYTPLSAYTDTYVTGGTYNKNSGVTTFSNNLGGTFTVTGYITTSVTGGIYSANTLILTGNLGNTSNTTIASITGITDTYVTGGTYSNGTLTLNRQNGTFNVTGLSTGYTLTSSAINTALGYTPLSADTFVTGGTYSNGTLTLNRQNGTFNVTGFLTGTTTDTYVTGFTYNNSNKLTISRNLGQPDLNLYINQFSGLTVNGNLVSNTISASTYYNLPKDIYVTGGTYNAGTGVATFTNNTGGTFNVTGFNTGTGSSTGLTASNYVVQGYLAANQSIPSNTDTVVQFVDDIDPQNWWNSSTYQFKPTIAGYYQINFHVLFDPGTVTNNQYNSQIRKNGSSQEAIWQNQITSTIGLTQGNNKILYLNGSTDYVDFTVYQANPGSTNIFGSSQRSQTFFHAHLLTGLNSSSFTASNLGSGTGIFAQKSGVDFQFKSLTSTGNTLSISNNSDTINIEVAPSNNFTGGTVNGRTTFTNGLSANTISATTLITSGDITANSLVSTQSSGNEGGEIRLSTSQTGNNLSGGTVTIDVYTNKLRIFESGGSNRGVYIDLTTASNSVGTNLSTDIYVTGVTYSSNTLTIKQNQGVPDITTTIGLAIKAGTVSNTSFTGNPKTYQVIFSTPYSNNYSISITGSDARTFTYESKTVNGFIINTNSNTSLTGDVDWQTIRNGES